MVNNYLDRPATVNGGGYERSQEDTNLSQSKDQSDLGSPYEECFSVRLDNAVASIHSRIFNANQQLILKTALCERKEDNDVV